jgi:hypothetical protein
MQAFRLALLILQSIQHFGQVLDFQRDQPSIYVSNPATKCCEKISHTDDLLGCVNEVASKSAKKQIVLVSYLTANIIPYGALI